MLFSKLDCLSLCVGGALISEPALITDMEKDVRDLISGRARTRIWVFQDLVLLFLLGLGILMTFALFLSEKCKSSLFRSLLVQKNVLLGKFKLPLH